MFVRNNPDIDFDALEKEVQERIARHHGQAEQQTESSASNVFAAASLDELYALDDEKFIHGVYCTFLGRDPDQGGLTHFLNLLRRGTSKSIIAAALRYSPEARARPQRFHLRRAWLAWMAIRTPLVGRLFEILVAMMGSANLKRTVLVMQRQMQEIDALKRALMLAEHEQNQLRQDAIAEMEKQLASLRRSVNTDFAALRNDYQSVAARLASGPVGSEAVAPALDEGFYLAFEEHFRGPAALIRERLSFYLPLLAQQLPEQLKSAPALDIGCGRGEWLSMLKEAGYNPLGVDLDQRNIGICSDKGLEALEDDGIAWLQRAHSESLAMISAFHVIEHLTTAQLNTLLVEAMRTLKPGGLLVLETPNPENLITAAHLFYIDPTHRHPLPPTLTEFLVNYRGFANVTLHRLNPVPVERHLPEQDELARRCNTLFYGPQDYAVVACKPWT